MAFEGVSPLLKGFMYVSVGFPIDWPLLLGRMISSQMLPHWIGVGTSSCRVSGEVSVSPVDLSYVKDLRSKYVEALMR